MEQQLFIGYLGVFFILLSKDLLALWLFSKLPTSGEEVTDGFGLMCSGIQSGTFVIAPMGVVRECTEPCLYRKHRCPCSFVFGALLGSPVHLNRTNPGEHLPYLRTSIQIAEHLTGVAFPEKSCKEQQQQPIPTQDVLQLLTAHVGCVCYQPM